MNDLLERALAAEERAEKAEAELVDVRARLKASLNADPATAVNALGWLSRCAQAEALVRQVLKWVDQQRLADGELPPGWVATARAQARVVEIAMRDQEGFQRPPDDDYWTTFRENDGRTSIIRESR